MICEDSDFRGVSRLSKNQSLEQIQICRRLQVSTDARWELVQVLARRICRDNRYLYGRMMALTHFIGDGDQMNIAAAHRSSHLHWSFVALPHHLHYQVEKYYRARRPFWKFQHRHTKHHGLLTGTAGSMSHAPQSALCWKIPR